MVRAGVPFAVLHGGSDLAQGIVTSDVDVVVGIEPIKVLETMRAQLEKCGLFPVLYWPYDVAGTSTVFLATGSASEGVQLDILYDKGGLGQYGVRSGVLLEAVGAGTRWPQIDLVHELLYLVSKRLRKGQSEALVSVVGEIRSMPQMEVEAAVGSVFRPDVARMVTSMVYGEGNVASGYSRRRALPEIRRRVTRAVFPIGYWVDVYGEGASSMASELGARFGRFLPHSVHGHRPSTGDAPLRWFGELAPTRWRAGIYVSWGSGRRSMMSDLSLQNADAIVLAQQTVEAMSARVWKRSRVWRSYAVPGRRGSRD